MEINISVLETRYIKINVFLCLGDHILVFRAPEFQRKLAQTCAGGDQYLVSRAQFCSDDREAASRTDWLPGSRLPVWPSMQVTTDLQAAPAACQSCQLLTSWKPWRAGDPPGCRCGSGEGPTRVGNCWRYMGFSVLKRNITMFNWD